MHRNEGLPGQIPRPVVRGNRWREKERVEDRVVPGDGGWGGGGLKVPDWIKLPRHEGEGAV